MLPDGEEAMAVTVSDSWAAVATSRRLLRLFAVTGLQRGMLSLPGPIVSMAAHGSKLLLVFHFGMGNDFISILTSFGCSRDFFPFACCKFPNNSYESRHNSNENQELCRKSS